MEQPTHDEQAQVITAFLFVQARPYNIEKLQKTFSLSDELFKQITDTIHKNIVGTGLSLLVSKKDISLTTDPQFGKHISKVIEDEEGAVLTPAQAETLSLVAYGDNITRQQLDYLRGVSSKFIVRLLLMRGLIEEQKNDNGTVLIPTGEFLRSVGVAQTNGLPEYETIQQEIWSALEGMNSN